MTDQPKVYCDDPLGNRNGPTAAARHRWVVALLTLALSGALVGCNSPSHSPNATAAVKPASGPASTGSPAAPASPGSPSAPASTGSPAAPASAGAAGAQ